MGQKRRPMSEICKAKIAYDVFEDAAQVAVKLSRNGHHLEAYPCMWQPERLGPHWHVGHVLVGDPIEVIKMRWEGLAAESPEGGWEKAYVHDVRILLDRLRGLPNLDKQRAAFAALEGRR